MDKTQSSGHHPIIICDQMYLEDWLSSWRKRIGDCLPCLWQSAQVFIITNKQKSSFNDHNHPRSYRAYFSHLMDSSCSRLHRAQGTTR